MNVLRFNKGCNGWETSFEAELDYEYTLSQEKRITALILYRPDLGKKVAIPWRIFEHYARGSNGSAFADSSGLRIRLSKGRLVISNGLNFRLVIHEDQVAAIKRAARNVVEDVSYTVENIFREYSVQSI
ncbi:MAG: hypothetical protein JW724_03145 [Candidatus Altiarchaeota archaeon]|nr:hypothetical protein [Candidatus Altiarchaeota archaeon]